MRILTTALLSFLLVVAGLTVSSGQGAGSIELTGEGIQAGTLTEADIRAFPHIDQDVSFQTSKGIENGHYKGALLWSVLEAHGIKGVGHNEHLGGTFVVEGSDGYRIAFSVGEIDPDFGAAPIIIAVEHDGRPLVPGEGFRLVVPGDKRGARYVKEVVKIEFR